MAMDLPYLPFSFNESVSPLPKLQVLPSLHDIQNVIIICISMYHNTLALEPNAVDLPVILEDMPRRFAAFSSSFLVKDAIFNFGFCVIRINSFPGSPMVFGQRNDVEGDHWTVVYD